MGIPGLTTYIINHSDRYLHYFELHDSYLVIDGNSVACQLYNLYANCNCVFGGDYDKYAQCVSDFFDSLIKCNITPLVIFDGGCEDKKLKVVIKRMKDKLRTASIYTPAHQYKIKFFPLLMKDVFKEVMNEKGIRYAQCILEADNVIAAVARILDCPVLSYDSDFFIYGVLYIPFNTLDKCTVRQSNGRGHAKRCKIYRVQTLFQSFKGLNQSLLPLAAILLGNDYVKNNTFKSFFRHMKLPKLGKKKFNCQQRRIEATLRWLCGFTLNKAVIGILRRLPKERRKEVLQIIETIVNSYNVSSTDILLHLGFSEEYTAMVNIQHINKNYKFEGDINDLTYMEASNDNESESSDDETEESDVADVIRKSDFSSNYEDVNKLPSWFVYEFNLGKFPSYFMDIYMRKLHVLPAQIEDFSQSPAIEVSLKIMSVIYGLLLSGTEKNNDQCINYMSRGKKERIECYRLDTVDSISGCKLPSLCNLRDVPVIIRRGVLNNILGIVNNDFLNDLPSEWMLHIATTMYWIQQQPLELNCYIYSLLFSMLFNVIDHKIGYCRNMRSFESKHSRMIQNVQYRRTVMKQCTSQYPGNFTVIEAYNSVHSEDALLAATFFVSHFQMNDKLYSNPKKFDISVVHQFSQFQNCLRYSMNLNALLGYPYQQPKVSTLFNGTLLYNLYVNFKRRNDIEDYINTVLGNSPSLLRLFHVLLLKLKPLLNSCVQSKLDRHKKRRVKYKTNECTQQTKMESLEPSTVHYDPNNHFSILGNM